MLPPLVKLYANFVLFAQNASIDMAKKLDISVSFLSSVEIGKKSVPVGLEEKIIELYDLDQEKALLLRKEAYV